jgi:AhpD family alkylhydroperoxidase
MTKPIYPVPSQDLVRERQALAPDIEAAFKNFQTQVFQDGALPGKIKQLIAVAAAHVTQCPYCISSHTKAALRHGATKEELMEAVWIAAEMRAGAAYAHSAVMIDALGEQISRG